MINGGLLVEELKKIWDKHNKKIIGGTLGVFVVPLICVHLLFKWKSGISFIEAEWGAGDLLGYIGTILSFIGTVILGFLALEVSNKANNLSQKVIKIEEERYKLDNRPFVLVSNWEAYEIDAGELIDSPEKKYIQIGQYQSGKALGLAVELTNTTESCISVQYSGGKVRNPEKSWGNAAINQQNLKMLLKPGDKDEFVFYATPSFMKGQEYQRVTVELTLENRFSKRYKETFVIIITSLSEQVFLDSKKWYCHLFAQEYTIGRFEEDDTGKIVCIKEEL